MYFPALRSFIIGIVSKEKIKIQYSTDLHPQLVLKEQISSIKS